MVCAQEMGGTLSAPLSLGQHPLKGLVILILLEDGHPRVSAVQDMINIPSFGSSQWSAHDPMLAIPTPPVQKWFLARMALSCHDECAG